MDKLKKILHFAVLPISFLYVELIIKAFSGKQFFGISLLYTVLFSFSAGLIASAAASLSKKPKINHAVLIVFMALDVFACGVQFFCRRTFGTYFGIGVMKLNAGGVIQDFGSTIIKIIYTGLPLIFLLALPLILYCIFGTKYLSYKRSEVYSVFGCIFTALVFHIVALLLIFGAKTGIVTDLGYYTDRIDLTESSDRFGLVTGMRLDIQNALFKDIYKDVESGGDIGDVIIEHETSKTEKESEKITESEPESDIGSESESETEPLPIDYGKNQMDIDFEAMSANTSDKTLLSMNEYFSSLEATNKNKYTGLFEGKNLIYFTAESFCPYFISEELTPALYKLTHTGFVFENYYQPAWGVSTSDGEYSGLTGLVPESGINSMYRSRLNNMYFSLGNEFSRLGYTTLAYHNHSMEYYSRHITHPNFGYDFYAIGNGVEKYTENVWPRSDLEMINGSLKEYIDKTPFHVYYMTVSGHGGYGKYGNSMSGRNIDKVEHLPYSDKVKAYIAAQLELENALQSLIKQLDEAGILDDTVIVLTDDHYPYGLDKDFEGNTEDYYAELAGKTLERNFEIYRNTLIIWCASMEETVTVSKPCYSLDILPTLLNLFGLEYDSRIICGKDILSDSEGFVLFRNYSWISERGAYNAITNTFKANPGASVDAEYVSEMCKRTKEKVLYSEYILEKNYYDLVIKNLK